MTKDDALKVALEELTIASSYCNTYDAIDVVNEALQQPAWVSLTEEEKDSLLLPFGSYWVIDAIETKLKEKNGV